MSTISRTAILMGRIHKLENYQAKESNLMQGIVFDGQLTFEQKEFFKSEKFTSIAKAKIKKAEMLKLKIAVALYDYLQQI